MSELDIDVDYAATRSDATTLQRKYAEILVANQLTDLYLCGIACPEKGRRGFRIVLYALFDLNEKVGLIESAFHP